MNNFVDSNDPEFTNFGSGFVSGFRNDENYKLAQSIKNQKTGLSRANNNS